MQSSGTSFVTGWASDKGCVRAQNEDAFLVAPQLGVWAVADGMGGHEDGRLASDVVVTELSKISPAATAMELRDRCEAAVVAANARLQALSSSRGGVVIGSTLVVLLVFDTFYACVWAGDSRIYLVRNGTINPLTRDHTELEDLIAKGVLTAEEARLWPRRNVITRAIGVSAEPDLEMISGDMLPGDAFVLCSDGLTSHVSAEEMVAVVSQVAPQEACDRLVQLTLDRGAADNVTIVVAQHHENTQTKETTLVEPTAKVMWERSDGK